MSGFKASVCGADEREEAKDNWLGCSSKPKMYPIFEVSVEAEGSPTQSQWRKYKEFAQLDQELRNHHSFFGPPIPNKSEFKGRGDMEKNAHRIKMLNAYIEGIMCSSAMSSPAFATWVGHSMPEGRRTPRNNSSDAPMLQMGSTSFMKVEEPAARQEVEHLIRRPENRFCVDCAIDHSGSSWISCNIGCVFCMKCSGIHRSLGVHISFVKSVELDLWTMKDVQALRNNNNDRLNGEWLARCPPDLRSFILSGPPSKWMSGNDAARTAYIRHKYDRTLSPDPLLEELVKLGVHVNSIPVPAHQM